MIKRQVPLNTQVTKILLTTQIQIAIHHLKLKNGYGTRINHMCLTLHLLKAVLEKIPPPPWNVGVIHLWEVDRKLPVYEIKEL